MAPPQQNCPRGGMAVQRSAESRPNGERAVNTADGVSSMDEICPSQMEVDDADRLTDAKTRRDVDADRIGNGCTHR